MVLKNLRKNVIMPVALVAMLLQVSACGTLMHPERKGQNGGNLDYTIVAYDAIGLIFFLVPGVIAYAVDFSNGTIYVPSGPSRWAMNTQDMKAVKVADGQKIDNQVIETAIKSNTGLDVNVADAQAIRV